MFYFLASYFILLDEFHDAILEYGPDNVVLELNKRSILNSTQYNISYSQELSKYLKSLILVAYIIEAITTRTVYEEFITFLSSDRRLWHLPIQMRQIICE